MSDPLKVYLHDHLAGATHAIEILRAMLVHYKDESLGKFSAELLADIDADQNVLKNLLERLGEKPIGIKELGAWLSEKISRLKLSHGSDGLGTFEALEFLVLGVHGKRALWRALSLVSNRRTELAGLNFDDLIARAENQESRAEEQRLIWADKSLAGM